MSNSIRAIQALQSGTNTDIKDVLDSPLYSTIELKTGIKEYQPFKLRKGEQGLTFADTNVQDGAQVPAKQRWTLNGLNVSILSKTVLSSATIAKLLDVVFNSSIRFEIDNSPKFETVLSDILGINTLIQAEDAVGSSNFNSLFNGKWKLKAPLILAGNTTYEFSMENLGDAIGSDLDGVKVRFTWDRVLERLV